MMNEVQRQALKNELGQAIEFSSFRNADSLADVVLPIVEREINARDVRLEKYRSETHLLNRERDEAVADVAVRDAVIKQALALAEKWRTPDPESMDVLRPILTGCADELTAVLSSLPSTGDDSR